MYRCHVHCHRITHIHSATYLKLYRHMLILEIDDFRHMNDICEERHSRASFLVKENFIADIATQSRGYKFVHPCICTSA